VLVGSRLHRSQQCARTAPRPNCTLGCIKPSTTGWSGEAIVPLHSALGRPHLEHWVQVWAPRFKKGMEVLKCIQTRATKPAKGLEGMACEEWLKTLGLSGLERRGLKATSLLFAAA